jgi:thymidylate kinase
MRRQPLQLQWERHKTLVPQAPFKALLIEGTSGVGKSTLIDALIRRHVSSAPPRKIRSLIHLAQSHTYGPLAVAEDERTLTAEQNTRHLERIVSAMEWLHAGVQEHDRPWCFVVIDTLHLTHCARPGVVKWTDVEAFDKRLANIGCRLLFLRASPSTIWKRGIESRMNDQFLVEYASKFGQSCEEIHSYFVEEQKTLADLFARSSLPKLLIEGEDMPEVTLDAAYEFWMEG